AGIQCRTYRHLAIAVIPVNLRRPAAKAHIGHFLEWYHLPAEARHFEIADVVDVFAKLWINLNTNIDLPVCKVKFCEVEIHIADGGHSCGARDLLYGYAVV